MQKICIQNFMAIENAQIEVQNLLLLLGEQASGKSTISKLIYLFKSLKQDLLFVISLNTWKTLPELKNEFDKHVQQKFRDIFGSTIRLPNFEITYFFTEHKLIQLSLQEDKSIKISIKGNKDLFNEELIKLILEVKRLSKSNGAYQLGLFTEALENLSKFVDLWFEDKRVPIFIPAGRVSTIVFYELFVKNIYEAKQESLPLSGDSYLLVEFLRRVDNIKRRFQLNFNELILDKATHELVFNRPLLELAQEKIKHILKGEYRQDESGEKIFYSPEGYVLLNQAASGQQESVRILQDIFLSLLDNEKACRIIEEPEAHLYPMAQKSLIELMVLMINNSDGQVILTTHSPYILSVINNLLFATRVVDKNQAVTAEVQDIISESCWLDSDKCAVYFLRDGYSQSIMDPETNLIKENFLDTISEELGEDFNKLYQIHARSFQ